MHRVRPYIIVESVFVADHFKEAMQLHHASILRNYIEQLYTNSDFGEDWITWVRQKTDWFLMTRETLQ